MVVRGVLVPNTYGFMIHNYIPNIMSTHPGVMNTTNTENHAKPNNNNQTMHQIKLVWP